MLRVNSAEGFAHWRDEVEASERPKKFVPYIPAIALIAVYLAGNDYRQSATSFNWRKAVLASDAAMDGFRLSIDETLRDRLTDTFAIPFEHLMPDEQTSLQSQSKYGFIMDGVPRQETHIPENELFLAETIGLGHHDECIGLRPLRLYAQGEYILRQHYPVTAASIT